MDNENIRDPLVTRREEGRRDPRPPSSYGLVTVRIKKRKEKGRLGPGKRAVFRISRVLRPGCQKPSTCSQSRAVEHADLESSPESLGRGEGCRRIMCSRSSETIGPK